MSKIILMNLITNPKLFNVAIITLYILSAIRFGFSSRWVDVMYSISAAVLTICVTFGYER